MDCKRPYKYRALKQIGILFCMLLLSSCTWVKDETENCAVGFWLNLHYTYNILDVEAAPEYISEVVVYIYDAEGNYVSRMEVQKGILLANNHRIRVEGLPEGDYQFVVWSGTADSHYSISGDRSTMDQFRLSLAGAGSNSADQLPDLYYGSLKTVHYDNAYALHDVYLMKNTNQLACLVVPLSSDSTVSPSDFDLKKNVRSQGKIVVEYEHVTAIGEYVFIDIEVK